MSESESSTMSAPVEAIRLSPSEPSDDWKSLLPGTATVEPKVIVAAALTIDDVARAETPAKSANILFIVTAPGPSRIRGLHSARGMWFGGSLMNVRVDRTEWSSGVPVQDRFCGILPISDH